MLVKAGDYIKWVDKDCCVYLVVKVLHTWPEINACGVNLRQTSATSDW